MADKAIVVLVDGMRADVVDKCGSSLLRELASRGTYAPKAKTVVPSITLPCHMSLFHSIDPSRHGILSNTYVPQVRPIPGLVDVLHVMGKHSAVFYNWEPLRDLWRPEHLSAGFFMFHGHHKNSDVILSDTAIKYIREYKPDFAFIYLGTTDECGHSYGWLSDKYMEAVRVASQCIGGICDTFASEYDIIITADHGGHERMHGFDIPEDMTIPLICLGDDFEAGKIIEDAKITDIAPTVLDIMNVNIPPEWEGRSLLE